MSFPLHVDDTIRPTERLTVTAAAVGQMKAAVVGDHQLGMPMIHGGVGQHDIGVGAAAYYQGAHRCFSLPALVTG